MARLFLLRAAALAGSVAFGAGGAYAQDLGQGDPAPAFELPGSDGRTHRLADYRGRTVVLAWFPKAFTGG